MAWQIAFLIIANDPARYRMLMIPSILEKFSFSGALALLLLSHQVNSRMTFSFAVDLFLGLLFTIAFFRTPARQG